MLLITNLGREIRGCVRTTGRDHRTRRDSHPPGKGSFREEERASGNVSTPAKMRHLASRSACVGLSSARECTVDSSARGSSNDRRQCPGRGDKDKDQGQGQEQMGENVVMRR